ncbi:hypothetical protein OM513_06370 [Sphingomonas canadensis]|nr:hypothetical protein [Sphingomonas canadensis]
MIGILAATGFPAQAQGIADFPFFRNVWQNVGPQAFPEGMRNPAELHASFRAERREAAWADGAERRIVGDLAALDVGTIAEKQVSCRRSICEVLFLVNRSSLPAAGNADERFNDALSGTIDGLAAGLGKKATFAITNGTDQPMIGVALYLHD